MVSHQVSGRRIRNGPSNSRYVLESGVQSGRISLRPKIVLGCLNMCVILNFS